MKTLTMIAVLLLTLLQTSKVTSEGNEATAGEQIKWQVIAGGGTPNGSSTNYKLSSSLGQTATGRGTSTNYRLVQGFQQNFSTSSYLCGDADGSGTITISDAVYLINYIFAGGPAPNPLLSGDADCSGSITISDAVYMINYIFAGGPAPCASCP